MHPYAIVTEASCDLSPERFASLQVLVVPVPLSINGKQYKGVSLEQFYTQLRAKAVIKTAPPNPEGIIPVKYTHKTQPTKA